MNQYNYRVPDISEKEISGTISSASTEAAMKQLRLSNYFIDKVWKNDTDYESRWENQEKMSKMSFKSMFKNIVSYIKDGSSVGVIIILMSLWSGTYLLEMLQLHLKSDASLGLIIPIIMTTTTGYLWGLIITMVRWERCYLLVRGDGLLINGLLFFISLWSGGYLITIIPPYSWVWAPLIITTIIVCLYFLVEFMIRLNHDLEIL